MDMIGPLAQQASDQSNKVHPLYDRQLLLCAEARPFVQSLSEQKHSNVSQTLSWPLHSC